MVIKHDSGPLEGSRLKKMDKEPFTNITERHKNRKITWNTDDCFISKYHSWRCTPHQKRKEGSSTFTNACKNSWGERALRSLSHALEVLMSNAHALDSRTKHGSGWSHRQKAICNRAISPLTASWQHCMSSWNGSWHPKLFEFVQKMSRESYIRDTIILFHLENSSNDDRDTMLLAHQQGLVVTLIQ